MLVRFWELLMGSESFNGSHYALLYFDQSFKALKKRKASAQVLNYCSHSDIVSRSLTELLLQPYHHYIWDLQLLSDRRHKGYEGLILEHRVTHCLHLSLSLSLSSHSSSTYHERCTPHPSDFIIAAPEYAKLVSNEMHLSCVILPCLLSELENWILGYL